MMISKTLVIHDPNGMHLRVAARVVKASQKHNAEVSFCANGKTANARSILELLLLEARGHSSVTVMAQGEDELRVMDQLEIALIDGAGI